MADHSIHHRGPIVFDRGCTMISHILKTWDQEWCLAFTFTHHDTWPRASYPARRVRGERWCDTEKRTVSKGAFPPKHQCCSVAPYGDFGTSRFKGSDIPRHLTHPGNRWVRTKIRLPCTPEVGLRLLSGVGPIAGVRVPPNVRFALVMVRLAAQSCFRRQFGRLDVRRRDPPRSVQTPPRRTGYCGDQYQLAWPAHDRSHRQKRPTDHPFGIGRLPARSGRPERSKWSRGPRHGNRDLVATKPAAGHRNRRLPGTAVPQSLAPRPSGSQRGPHARPSP